MPKQRYQQFFPARKIHEQYEAALPGSKVDLKVSVFVTAALEYIAAELLEISMKTAAEKGRKGPLIITVEDVKDGVKADPEIKEMLSRINPYLQ